MDKRSALAPAKILIVDDDAGTVRILGEILSEAGVVYFALDGSNALAMLREHTPDIVLLDAQMPGMDGFEVCRAIKEDPEFYDLPVLFVTSHDEAETELRALETGAVDFITKPLNPPLVSARVKTHLLLKQRNDQLRLQAFADGLTGVANRRAFDKTIVTEWRRASRSGSPLSLILIDVDNFKRFNDHYGHLAGDDALRAIAEVLCESAKRPGELVCRYGGEEFGVILPECGGRKALQLAEIMRQQVERLEIPVEGSSVANNLTISAGLASTNAAFYRKLHESANISPALSLAKGIEKLKSAADAALYAAKNGGRNKVVLSDTPDLGS